MPHVDDGTLHALLDGALRAHEPDRADRVEAHLDACADCRARLEEAAALRDRASDVLADIDAGLAADAAADREAAPDFRDVLGRAAGPDPATPSPAPERDVGLRRRYAWTRGLAWAATIVVALGTGYLVRDIADPTGVVPRAVTTEASDRAAEPTAAEAVRADRPEADGGEPTAVAEPLATGQAEDAAKAARADGRQAPSEAEQAAPGPGAADAMAPPPPAAGGGQAETMEVAAETGWRTVAVEEAETRAGTLLVLPGATIATAEVDEGSVRTRQQLPDSVEVVVVQHGVDVVTVQREAPMTVSEEPVAEATAAAALRDQAGQQRLRLQAVQAMAPAEAVPTLLGLDLDSTAATVDAPVTVTVVRDGQSLTLTASLPEDVLLALAATAAPRTP